MAVPFFDVSRTWDAIAGSAHSRCLLLHPRREDNVYVSLLSLSAARLATAALVTMLLLIAGIEPNPGPPPRPVTPPPTTDATRRLHDQPRLRSVMDKHSAILSEVRESLVHEAAKMTQAGHRHLMKPSLH